MFLATLVDLHSTPVSESVGRSAEFQTSVPSRLASLFMSQKLGALYQAYMLVVLHVLRADWHPLFTIFDRTVKHVMPTVMAKENLSGAME